MTVPNDIPGETMALDYRNEYRSHGKLTSVNEGRYLVALIWRCPFRQQDLEGWHRQSLLSNKYCHI